MMRLERVKGIEPSCSAWEAAALPLSYTRNGLLMGENGRGVKLTLRYLADRAIGPSCRIAVTFAS